MILYIAGPITGFPDYRRAFEEAACRLVDAGYRIVTPLALQPAAPPSLRIEVSRTPTREAPWSWWMRSCLRALTGVDGVALLEGWAGSPGATWEQKIASQVLDLETWPAARWVEHAHAIAAQMQRH